MALTLIYVHIQQCVVTPKSVVYSLPDLSRYRHQQILLS